ncbi:MAG: SRPBCC domain-containing protein [Bacteroidia bacterium]
MLIKTYQIDIHADKATVWFCLWDDFHYRAWTSVFCEGSHAITDNWQQGSKVHFLDSNGSGMYSTVTENVALEKMYFRHHGTIKNYEEQEIDAETQKWTGGRENYTLTEVNGITTVSVEIDVYEDYLSFFEENFPNALLKVKALAEDFHITVQTEIDAPLAVVWEKWTQPEHITKWCYANEAWHAPHATNNLRVGGKFTTRMEAKDRSMGFDFEGIYTQVSQNQYLEYEMADGRKVKITFAEREGKVHILESFHAERENSFELQRDGWQAILTNFKNYVIH